MEWTPELAQATDAKVRTELSTSRASLVRFVAENAWQLLPQPYTTAAAYVQDAAGVKRSEAYRLVATARVAQLLATTFLDEADTNAYKWLVNDAIRSTHTGEHLSANAHSLTEGVQRHLDDGQDPYRAILAAIEAHQRPAGDSDGDQDGTTESNYDSLAEDSPAAGGGSEPVDLSQIERAERLIICPNCQTTLR